MARLDDVVRFYELLDDLSQRVGGPRRLADCTWKSRWPAKGVYFFFESDEQRSTSGTGLRVLRVGTHALTGTSNTTLWQRLSAHRGFVDGEFAGGGNHRASVFRRHVGAAIIASEQLTLSTWGIGATAPREVRVAEHSMELRVSAHIRAMPFLWLDVSHGLDGGRATRARIETNSIGLLSNWRRLGTDEAIDPPSVGWLGACSPNAAVRQSGLWNVRHVGDGYDPTFLADLAKRV
jgi:hypothetical protein